MGVRTRMCVYVYSYKWTADPPPTKNTRKQDMPNFADGLHINVTVCGQTYYSDQARICTDGNVYDVTLMCLPLH